MFHASKMDVLQPPCLLPLNACKCGEQLMEPLIKLIRKIDTLPPCGPVETEEFPGGGLCITCYFQISQGCMLAYQ